MEFDRLRAMPENQGRMQRFAIDQAQRILSDGGVVMDPLVGTPASIRGSELRQRYLEQVEGTRNTPLKDLFPIGYSPSPTIEEWLKDRSNLVNNRFFVNVYNFIIESEIEAIKKLGLTTEEKTLIADLALPEKIRASLARYSSRERLDPGQDRLAVSIGKTIDHFLHDGLPAMVEVGSLTMRTEQEVLDLRNIGPRNLRQIKANLSSFGLRFAAS